MKNIIKQWHRYCLALILLLAGFLSTFGIWNEGYGNEFYAACVKSMLTSWKNFFFVSLDPGGWVTVDKPPVSLWVQALFAKVLGFSGWSIILPECLAAVASVAILYYIVKCHFGKIAGLISALALALSPIFIAVSRTNNTDSILILTMLLATWAMIVAADKGQLRYLILSVVLLGVAYNAKTLEAFLILPALYAVYFFTTNLKWRKRIWHLAVASLVLILVSLSWSIIVDLTPANDRPYVDNSTTNSELELAIGYNGIQRLTGNSGGAPSTNGNKGQGQEFGQPPANSEGINMPVPTGNLPTGNLPTGSNAPNVGNPPTSTNNNNNNNNPGAMFEGGGGGEKSPTNQNAGNNGGNNGGNSMFDGGSSPSILRMFNQTLGGQDSWLLPFAIFAIIALILRMCKAASADDKTRKRLLRNAILWGGSVITMFVYFSVSNYFHAYYISVMAPCIAALVGIGLVEMWKLYKSGGAASFILPIAMAVTSAIQIVMLTYYPTWAIVMIPLVVVFACVPTVLLFVFKLKNKDLTRKIVITCVAIGITGLFITPAVWSYTPILLGVNASIPTAGPTAGSTAGPTSSANNMGAAGIGTDSDKKLISFLVNNNTGEKFLVAVSNAAEAEPIILATDKPVMAIGGFSGNDKTLTVAKLEQMVKAGQIKYYLVDGADSMGGGNSTDDLTTWVKANGKVVEQSDWSDTSTSAAASTGNMGQAGGSETLYDLSSYKNAT